MLSLRAAFSCTVMVKQWGTGLALDATAAQLINQNAFLQAVEGPGLEGGAQGAQSTASQETPIPRCPPAHPQLWK